MCMYVHNSECNMSTSSYSWSFPTLASPSPSASAMPTSASTISGSISVITRVTLKCWSITVTSCSITVIHASIILTSVVHCTCYLHFPLLFQSLTNQKQTGQHEIPLPWCLQPLCIRSRLNAGVDQVESRASYKFHWRGSTLNVKHAWQSFVWQVYVCHACVTIVWTKVRTRHEFMTIIW